VGYTLSEEQVNTGCMASKGKEQKNQDVGGGGKRGGGRITKIPGRSTVNRTKGGA